MIQLRAEVRKFAEQMELKLRENDHKGGWRNMDIMALAARIDDEKQELYEALLLPNPDIHDVIGECADVANFAMMVADVAYRYGIQRTE